MIVDVAQRWRGGRASYRPAGELFDPTGHEVAEIADDATAKAFVVRHHYAASYPAARWRMGLYASGALVGVAVFSVPMRREVLRPFPDLSTTTELGRFVLVDSVRANGESWFLARCFDLLRRRGLEGVVSFSDPFARTTATGERVFAGHVGTIYQATNAVFLGQRRPERVFLLKDGTVFHRRALSKIRGRETGMEYAVRQLVAAGAPEPQGVGLDAWLGTALAETTRSVLHPGNLKYALPLTRGARRALPDSLPYPKRRGVDAWN